MPSSRFTYLWIQDGIPARRLLGGPLVPLEERLSALAEDDSASVEALVLQAAEIVFGWALEHDESWTSERAGLDLESGVADLEARHGWRGPLALLLDSLRQAWSATSGDDALGPRAALSEEAGLWIWSQREDVERWPDLAGAWTGEALVPGRRLPSRAELARHAAAELEPRETVLVGGFSEALVQALTLAAREGKRPRVLCAEGQPLLEGRRLARRLVGEELEIELVHDAALLDCVSEADRIWIASEALGARGSLVRVGTSRVAREALDEGVPLRVLATSDALLPGGELLTPRWIELDRTLLWVGAPETIELRTRFLEPLSFELAGELLTENGRESAEELFLRALRIEPVPRCAGFVPRELPAARATPRHYAPRGANAHVSAAAIPAIAPATASAAHEQLRPAPRGAQPTSIRSGEEADSPRIT